jgi:hypothetical protein
LRPDKCQENFGQSVNPDGLSDDLEVLRMSDVGVLVLWRSGSYDFTQKFQNKFVLLKSA